MFQNFHNVSPLACLFFASTQMSALGFQYYVWHLSGNHNLLISFSFLYHLLSFLVIVSLYSSSLSSLSFIQSFIMVVVMCIIVLFSHSHGDFCVWSLSFLCYNKDTPRRSSRMSLCSSSADSFPVFSVCNGQKPPLYILSLILHDSYLRPRSHSCQLCLFSAGRMVLPSAPSFIGIALNCSITTSSPGQDKTM